MMMTQHKDSNSKVWLGIFLVALGSYFLLRNLDVIPSFLPSWLFDWEMIFILIGGAMMLSGKREGLVFLVIGGFSLLPEILNIPNFHMRDWWPLILIVIGLSIFFKRRNHTVKVLGGGSDEYFEDTSIFGGSEKSISSPKLKAGKITAIFGGSEINLVGTELGEKEVVIDYLCLFGGNVLIVPNDWTVINESFTLFGGYSDARIKNSGVKHDPEKVLRLKGVILFGGAEVNGA